MMMILPVKPSQALNGPLIARVLIFLSIWRKIRFRTDAACITQSISITYNIFQYFNLTTKYVVRRLSKLITSVDNFNVFKSHQSFIKIIIEFYDWCINDIYDALYVISSTSFMYLLERKLFVQSTNTNNGPNVSRETIFCQFATTRIFIQRCMPILLLLMLRSFSIVLLPIVR